MPLTTVSTATLPNPICLFFFLNESYYCKPLIETRRLPSPPARMYLTFLFRSGCCSEFGSLLWSDEVKSPTRLAPSLAEGNVSFAISHARVSFQKGRTFFSPPGELDLHLSCVNLALFKVSILDKRTFFHHRFASIPCDKAYISGGERLVFLCTTLQVCTAVQQTVHTLKDPFIGQLYFYYFSVFECIYYLIFLCYVS